MGFQYDMKRKREESGEEEDESYLSDESAFYGDEATKRSFEKRVRSFSPQEWWESHTPSLIEISRANLTKTSAPKTSYLYNPYEGHTSGRQLGETVEQFLERLPPRTTPQSDSIPWIFIANPYRPKPVPTDGALDERGVDTSEEGAMANEANWAEFLRQGGKLLEELTRTRHQIEKENVGKATQTITKKLNPKRDDIVRRLLALAIELKCASGKWMIFCEPEDVDAVWRIVAKATANNELGRAAKVAPDGGDGRNVRLICVYTENFADLKDVTRVAAKLKDLGVIGARGIYYKCNAYTYLGLGSGNEYKIKASLYNSADILRNGRGKEAQSESLYTKKKDAGDDWWKSLAYE